ncbi:MAG: TPM domain-containing protein [Lachnospiraceae bacterium]|nr:TPM domain-containing protein [Lachnospiraceae bacterium]
MKKQIRNLVCLTVLCLGLLFIASAAAAVPKAAAVKAAISKPVFPEAVILAEASAEPGHPKRLIDEADILDASEEEKLLSDLNEISERQQCDVAVITINSLAGKTAAQYADDFYDENAYGMGAEDSGILLLIAMDDRQWAISTYGFGITAFTDAGLDYIEAEFKPYLSDGEYYKAFDTFAGLCDRFVTQASEDEAYDGGNMPKEYPSLLWIPGAFLLGAVFAFIITASMKGQLKNVHRQAGAGNYVKDDSFHVSESRDLFLYSRVARHPRPKQNDSGGGSSLHTSSSGRSHGGSSGSF